MIDSRKLQPRLLSSWRYIPVEVAPIAARRVMSKLSQMGSVNPAIRKLHGAKHGPLKTDQGFFIIDAPFPVPLLTRQDVAAGMEGGGKNGVWEVEHLAHSIKDIVGVLEVGLFAGPTGPQAQAQFQNQLGGERPVAAYFGMPDGSVKVRKAVQ